MRLCLLLSNDKFYIHFGGSLEYSINCYYYYYYYYYYYLADCILTLLPSILKIEETQHSASFYPLASPHDIIALDPTLIIITVFIKSIFLTITD